MKQLTRCTVLLRMRAATRRWDLLSLVSWLFVGDVGTSQISSRAPPGPGASHEGRYFAQRLTRIIYSAQFLTWHALHKLIVFNTDRNLSCGRFSCRPFSAENARFSFGVFANKSILHRHKVRFASFAESLGPNTKKALILIQKLNCLEGIFGGEKSMQRKKICIFLPICTIQSSCVSPGQLNDGRRGGGRAWAQGADPPSPSYKRSEGR